MSQTLGYLGSCRINATPEQQQVFWAQVENNLQAHMLSEADKAKIENAIAQKVAQITYSTVERTDKYYPTGRSFEELRELREQWISHAKPMPKQRTN